jgi:ATP-dependent DNA ligase
MWRPSKCLNREEFVVVGWTDPEGSRQHIGALLLGYYTEDGRLHCAGCAGTGINDRELKRLAGVLAPHSVRSLISTGIMSFGSIGSSLASGRGSYRFPRRSMRGQTFCANQVRSARLR